jgi:hypothetical protein
MTALYGKTYVFVVRLWREPREIEGAAPEWRGVVESVVTGERVYFRSLDKMNAFIIERSGAWPLQPPAMAGPGKWKRLVRRLRGCLGLAERP